MLNLGSFLIAAASIALAPQHAKASITSLSHTSAATAACNELGQELSGKVAFDPLVNQNSATLNDLYNTTRTTYWNAANSVDRPTCMVFPASAQDVSTSIKTLHKYETVPFNLKSGGHNWNYGFSSTNGGVLISFRPNMQNTTIAADHNTAEVGPGAKWKEVMAELNKYNRCAVGGRNDDVGVGGYVILGGLSYLTGAKGFSSDNVVNFETVLADGSIVNANATSNPDLYFALRGGGANYAVVTKYTLIAHPIGSVWGGPRLYTSDKAPQLISAISNYVLNFNPSVADSALLPTIAWPSLLNGSDIWTIFMYWNGTSPPADLFKEFFEIEAIADQTKVQTYPELLNMDALAGGFSGRTTDRVAPYANLPHDNMTEFLTWHYNQVKNSSIIKKPGDDFVLFSMALQPIPVDLQRANSVGMPGALSIDPAGGDKLWIEYSYIWKNASTDAMREQQVRDLTTAADAHQQVQYAGIKPTKYKSGVLPFVAYNPIFANDGQADQQIFPSYGVNTFAKLEATRWKYDPTLFFQRRMRGFHLDLPSQ